jgi:hypothetical protein
MEVKMRNRRNTFSIGKPQLIAVLMVSAVIMAFGSGLRLWAQNFGGPIKTTGQEYRATMVFKMMAASHAPGSLSTSGTSGYISGDEADDLQNGIILRIDLIELKSGETRVLSSRTIETGSGKLSEHQIFFTSSISPKQIATRLKILPEILPDQSIRLDLAFRVSPEMEDFQEEAVVTRQQESAVLEFLESPNTQTKIAFRVTPLNVLNAHTSALRQQAQKSQPPPVTENVFVRWWVVPVFAVDENGNSITDLKEGDLAVTVDNRTVDAFSLYKKEFDVSKTVKVNDRIVKGKEVKKTVFLVFDNFFSSHLMLSKSRSIARSLIDKSENDSRYVVLSLEFGVGLKYIAGPTNSKKEVFAALKKITPTMRGMQRYNPLQSDISTQTKQIRRPRTVMGPSQFRLFFNQTYQNEVFLKGIQTLDTALKTMVGSSRVVYFFSTGMPEETLYRRVATSVSISAHYYEMMKHVGQVLNRSSAMLFVINPEGTRLPSHDNRSGEISLKLLAENSGGRYYEGDKKDIAKKVVNMDRAFYDIAFPDIRNTDPGDETEPKMVHSIKISSKRKGVEIYSVKKITRGRDYSDMTDTEKEVLVLNAIEKGYLSKIKLNASEIKLQTVTRSDNSSVCRMVLPEQMVHREWDVYRVAVNGDTLDVKMNTESLIPTNSYIDVTFKHRKGYKNYLVVIHSRKGTAYIGRQPDN